MVQMFICGARSSDKAYCRCGMRATKRCCFKLGGRKAGQVCNALLCQRCATPQGKGGDPGFCGPHARLAKRTDDWQGLHVEENLPEPDAG